MNEQESYAPPLALPSEKADLLDKIQPTLIVDIVFHKLLGEEFINGAWVKNPLLQKRALTIQGAHEISTLMTPVSSQNVALSKLKDSEIRMRALSVSKTAQFMCLDNWKEYGIKNTSQLHFVHELIFSNTFITLKQPEGAGLRNLIGDIGSGEIGYPREEEKKGWNLLRR